MKKYLCNSCNFESDNKTDYNRHVKTNKHKEKVKENTDVFLSSSKVSQGFVEKTQKYSNKYVCNICEKSYTHKSSLSNHSKICKSKETIIQEYVNNQKIQEEKIKHLEDKIKILTEDRTSYKNIAESTVETAKVSANALSYAIKNYKNAPAIQTFNNFKLLLGNETHYSIAEIVIHYHIKKELPQYIGNVLIKEYKKENPNDQSLYNTDTTRALYIIKEIIDEESEWLTDKGAVKTSKYTIKPILDYLKIHLVKYFDDTKLEMASDTSNKLFNNMIIAQEIINNINTGVLNKDIIKYVSSYFHIDRKNIKQIEMDNIISE